MRIASYLAAVAATVALFLAASPARATYYNSASYSYGYGYGYGYSVAVPYAVPVQTVVVAPVCPVAVAVNQYPAVQVQTKSVAVVNAPVYAPYTAAFVGSSYGVGVRSYGVSSYGVSRARLGFNVKAPVVAVKTVAVRAPVVAVRKEVQVNRRGLFRRNVSVTRVVEVRR